ncbi:hypothetical protein A3D77_05510 [Candidatus Gottesmanbacteria bacterium RIFCSPHIGHO2_02_FULL_39_11]|uniref:Uncharacterized protein n=1 Tax=Candidatus Gottesmanbacteria bacterium RIFCSPHIGHO2_02_FULL_39_11 TaxID=1798382 RepID=A0A1F5ZLD8_9BACT|nr:MAG: hypothetical protein A3D77_05510 [Candidatus Gottesmanbacteria bacterium RIFCSPHIGHO2_02_FULL_39_11]
MGTPDTNVGKGSSDITQGVQFSIYLDLDQGIHMSRVEVSRRNNHKGREYRWLCGENNYLS